MAISVAMLDLDAPLRFSVSVASSLVTPFSWAELGDVRYSRFGMPRTPKHSKVVA